LDEKRNEFQPLLKFAAMLASVLVIVLSLFAFTPLAEFWFMTVSGLSPGMADFARLPLIIMFFFPALTVLISIQRGLLVSDKNTKPITMGTTIEFVTIVITLLILINFLDLIGAVAATIGFVAGRLAANFYLINSSFNSIKHLTKGRVIEQ
jgi:O-antigen/teichoic acid export membrane protein